MRTFPAGRLRWSPRAVKRDPLWRAISTGEALILVLGMSALGILSVAVAIRLALAPLSRIEAALLKRDPHDLQALDVETPREVEALITSINGFMERLAGRIRVMHRFIADATHQIRTPLTALASQVDLLRDELHEERRARQIERLQERTSELGRLTNQVLKSCDGDPSQ